MKLRCCILDDYQNVALAMADWSVLGDHIEISACDRHLEGEALVAALTGCQIVVAMRERTRFDAALVDRLSELKLLVTSGMRNSAIDFEAARMHGISVCGTSSQSEPPAELTWTLILALLRNLVGENAALRSNGRWQSSVGGDLAGRTIGIVGLGKIGTRVARVATAFGMNVIAWSPHLTKDRAAAAGATLSDKLDLFAQSDICTVHMQLAPSTRGLIGAAEIAAMKPAALFINTARSGLVDTAALVEALQHHRIAGAGIDVFDIEPLPGDHPFRTLPNVLATPHLGYVTQSNYKRYFAEAVEDIAAFVAGNPIRVLS